jgi:dihydroorotate dehydrogenase (NAD+) catalytic subunit
MVDTEKEIPRLATVTGGLSGPAIKPVALAQIHKVYERMPVPIVGMGGIESLDDILGFALVGAAAVQIGTRNFVRADSAMTLLSELEKHLKTKKRSFQSYVGAIKIAAPAKA